MPGSSALLQYASLEVQQQMQKEGEMEGGGGGEGGVHTCAAG